MLDSRKPPQPLSPMAHGCYSYSYVPDSMSSNHRTFQNHLYIPEMCYFHLQHVNAIHSMSSKHRKLIKSLFMFSPIMFILFLYSSLNF